MAIKIFIDQGHNPGNPNAGAEGNGLYEQDITYEVGRLTAELLRENPEFEVRLSRNTPTEILGTSVASRRKFMGSRFFHQHSRERLDYRIGKRKRGLCLFRVVSGVSDGRGHSVLAEPGDGA